MIPLLKSPEQPARRHYLFEWRLKRKLSQRKFANAVCDIMGKETFDRSRVSRIERLKEGMTEDNVYIFAQVLDIAPGQIFQHPKEVARQQEILTKLSNKPDRVIDAVLAAIDVIDKSAEKVS